MPKILSWLSFALIILTEWKIYSHEFILEHEAAYWWIGTVFLVLAGIYERREEPPPNVSQILGITLCFAYYLFLPGLGIKTAVLGGALFLIGFAPHKEK